MYVGIMYIYMLCSWNNCIVLYTNFMVLTTKLTNNYVYLFQVQVLEAESGIKMLNLEYRYQSVQTVDFDSGQSAVTSLKVPCLQPSFIGESILKIHC